ncbi:chromosomal replication initiator protein DnaA [Streptococcus sp. sy010]|uniref:chromosomal replication initiator protein DnaA n=1 Tax=Streptococcus sp. sy010 TaxID=2600148 RepID=UPI0011B5ADA5|nr:chromosomal replication initiator protein DnaA [Streptococcus sp. sy010]TWT14378.1 chromosomal replication initiator protein DnaA [Streptococcus sp. sy010]
MTPQEQQFWQRFLSLAESRLGQNAYQFYIKPAKLLHIKENIASIQLNSDIQQLFWETSAENLIENLIKVTGLEIFDQEIKTNYVIGEPKPIDEEELNSQSTTDFVTQTVVTKPLQTFPSNLNGSYHFSNFIQGKGNEWAVSACLATTDKPGINYNPLFIWGGPGLGKTHLLNAVGNAIQNDEPLARILYITTENFVNEFVTATRLGTMDDFREKFRNLDVLLIDDVQFLANKESTQEEFFNIFNTLHDKKKQIILTSDRAPKSLESLPDRLVTRFAWDLTVHITPPDFETRVAIIEDKIQQYDFNFEKDAIEYLANLVDSNVRDLEGALKNIHLAANLEKAKVITVELVAKAIRSRTTEAPKINVIPIETIQEEVGKFYGVTVKEIKSTKRPQNLALARQVAIYLSRELTDNSTTKIGKEFGGRDHSTVLHAYNKIKNMMTQDESLSIEINTIKNKLK